MAELLRKGRQILPDTDARTLKRSKALTTVGTPSVTTLFGEKHISKIDKNGANCLPDWFNKILYIIVVVSPSIDACTLIERWLSPNFLSKNDGGAMKNTPIPSDAILVD